MRGQISSVHILRGIAALLVVWAHLSAYWLFTIRETSSIQDAWATTIARPLHVYQDGGFLGVLIFFLISGYIVTHASLSETRLTYLTKRVFRIFPPLLFALAVLWVLMHLMPALGFQLRTFHGGPPLRWLQSLLLLDGFTPGPYILSITWTLAVEILFYALVLGVIGQQRRHPLATTWVMVGVWIAGGIATFYVPLFDQPLQAEVEGRELVIFVGVLLVGRCTYLAHARLASGWAATSTAVAIGVTVGTLQEVHDPGFLLTPNGFSDTEPVLAYAVAIAVFVAMLWWSPTRAAQPFGWLGDISYSLYLLHMPVGFATLGVLYTYDVPNSAATLIAIAASMLAATLAFHLVERPSQRMARALLARAPRTVPGAVSSPRPAGHR